VTSVGAGGQFLRALVEVDRRTAEQIQGQPCRRCQGPLHAGNYGRKPRGLPAGLEEAVLPEFWCAGACAAAIAGGAPRHRR